MGYIIRQWEKEKDYNISFVYNRFDLIYENNNYILTSDDDKSIVIPVHVEGKNAFAGLWLADISTSLCENIFDYILNYFKLDSISYKNSICAVGKYSISNQWKILLPEAPDELSARLKKKGKYNLRREEKLLNEEHGPCHYYEYSDIPEEIVKDYFIQKKENMGTEYEMTPYEYIEEFHVTNGYVMKINDEIISVLFSCEQTRFVYLENLSYKKEYAKYSCGFLLYTYFLNTLISKGKAGVYLGDGHQQYKTRYGAVEQETYNGTYFKNKSKELEYFVKRNIMNRLFRK